MVIVPVVAALGGVVLSELHGAGVASDRTKVTIVPSVFAGSVWRVYSCQSEHTWSGSTSPHSSQGSERWGGHESLTCHVAKSNEGVVANPRLSTWPGFSGSTGPRSFGLLLADVSWATRPAI